MMMRCMIVTLLASLGGCVTTQDMYFSDGSRGHGITCEGLTSSSMNYCFEEAGKICGSKGYDILPMRPGVVIPNSLFIKCKQ